MHLPLSELKTRLVSLPNNVAVIYTGIYYTSEGVSYVPAELTSQIAEWANRPVVINVSSYLNKGAWRLYRSGQSDRSGGRTPGGADSRRRESIGPTSCEGSFTTHLRVAGAAAMEDQ